MTVKVRTPDILTGWKAAFLGMIEDKPGYTDLWNKNILHSFDNVIASNSAVMDFDFGQIGITKTKWTKFTGMYVDVPSLWHWIKNAKRVKTYDSLYHFKAVPPQYRGGKAVHQWGPCLIAMSFRRRPRPHLTLYSRAQSLGFSGVIDYGLMHVVARLFAEELNIPQERIQLTIYCENFVIKTVELLHTLHAWGLVDELKKPEHRISEALHYYEEYFANPADPLPWRAANRFRTKYQRSQAGVYFPMPADSLQLRGWGEMQRSGEQMSLVDTQRYMLGHDRVTQHTTAGSKEKAPAFIETEPQENVA